MKTIIIECPFCGKSVSYLEGDIIRFCKECGEQIDENNVGKRYVETGGPDDPADLYRNAPKPVESKIDKYLHEPSERFMKTVKIIRIVIMLAMIIGWFAILFVSLMTEGG